MTGPRGGVIGVRREQALERFIRYTNVRFETSDEDPWLNAVLVEAGADGRATAIRQLLVPGSLKRAGATSATATSSARVAQRHHARPGTARALDQVEVARGELDEGEDRRRGDRRRASAHAPRQRQRAQRQRPDQVLRREHLAERREGRHRRPATPSTSAARVAAAARRSSASSATDGQQRELEAPTVERAGRRVLEAVRAVAACRASPCPPRRRRAPGRTSAGGDSICTGRSIWYGRRRRAPDGDMRERRARDATTTRAPARPPRRARPGVPAADEPGQRHRRGRQREALGHHRRAEHRHPRPGPVAHRAAAGPPASAPRARGRSACGSSRRTGAAQRRPRASLGGGRRRSARQRSAQQQHRRGQQQRPAREREPERRLAGAGQARAARSPGSRSGGYSKKTSR